MPLYSNPPPLSDFSDEKPTLLVCWWLTIFCTVIILLRVAGRFVRSERLFTEDKTVALALIPLHLRMACVHLILLWGTNNAQLADANLSDDQIRHKSIASGLVLLSRIFYAATLWVLKATIVEFLSRLIRLHWRRTCRVALIVMRCTLGGTFVAIIISDLAECQPFSHYWQVLPDPGGQCRQGYVQLITMAACNVLTDLLLIIFPVPIIIGRRGHDPVPELFFATVSANALVLGSFVRNKGTKKYRFKYGSVIVGSPERPAAEHGSVTRRPTALGLWGSDEDLVRDIGFSVAGPLRDKPDPDNVQSPRRVRPAPMATTALGLRDDRSEARSPGDKPKKAESVRSDEVALRPCEITTSSRTNLTTHPRVSFFDVGGLLDGPSRLDGYDEHVTSETYNNNLVLPPSSVPAGTGGLHRGSVAFLQDIGCVFATSDAVPNSPGSETCSQDLRRSH
ncbi:hypothetical protein P8C59_001434 [Phyllachora maydis]|uniref:Rhodopsin domain-containing protein n=1 Tax=Phyllachora maydis TaxID=1825666 RepID=A0AAD9HYD7_9PEZI|nr:hypothetical protein P8C59_001434 [Phyllachora maydis]